MLPGHAKYVKYTPLISDLNSTDLYHVWVKRKYKFIKDFFIKCLLFHYMTETPYNCYISSRRSKNHHAACAIFCNFPNKHFACPFTLPLLTFTFHESTYLFDNTYMYISISLYIYIIITLWFWNILSWLCHYI